MSKPRIPGELRDVEVHFVSLVDKAATGKKFQIFKSENFEEGAPTEKGLFNVLKEFFAGKEIHKGEMADVYNAKKRSGDFWAAMDAFANALGLGNRFGEQATGTTVTAEKLEEALADMQVIVRDIFGVNTTFEGGNEVTKEEIQAIVKSSVEEAAKELKEQLAALETEEGPAEVEKAAEEEAKEIQETIVEAIKAAMEPIEARLARVEKSRGVSQTAPESTNVEKEENIWGGVFLN